MLTILFLHGAGLVQNKDQWLIAVKGLYFLSRVIDSQEVELHENVAITTGRISVTIKDKPSYWVTYVRVYQYLNGRWQMLSHRTTSFGND